VTLDNSLQPSAEAEPVLRGAGWSPVRAVDPSEWVETLRRDGNEVFPLAEAIMRNFGDLCFRGPPRQRGTRHDFEINPYSWYHQRDRVVDIEEIVGSRVYPLGETSGAAMLAILEDGRVISEMDGEVHLIGDNWRSALDFLILGRGKSTTMAVDYEPVERQ
jgi:hypothetical protein